MYCKYKVQSLHAYCRTTQNGHLNVQSYMLISCTLTVVEESPEATAVEMIQDCQKKALIELKGCRKLDRR